MTTIDYKLLSEALTYYQERAYSYVEVPWLVSREANLATLPEGKDLGQLSDGRCLIGSAEQGFIQNLDQLQEGVRYISVSPCFRIGDNRDGFHHETFIKAELAAVTSDKDAAQSIMRRFIEDAKELFTNLTGRSVREFNVGPDQIDLENGVELGSYGIREIAGKYLVYGTGLALPRLTQSIPPVTFGYHKRGFIKGELGDLSKIREEVSELEDAYAQNDKILMLCELSDLVGAIESFAQAQLGTELADLITFSNKTKSAFGAGRR